MLFYIFGDAGKEKQSTTDLGLRDSTERALQYPGEDLQTLTP